MKQVHEGQAEVVVECTATRSIGFTWMINAQTGRVGSSQIHEVSSKIEPTPAPTGAANGLSYSGSPTRRRSSAKRGSERRLSRRASVVR
jgi:hypothetical protein